MPQGNADIIFSIPLRGVRRLLEDINVQLNYHILSEYANNVKYIFIG